MRRMKKHSPTLFSHKICWYLCLPVRIKEADLRNPLIDKKMNNKTKLIEFDQEKKL